MTLRAASRADAPILAALSIEVWLGTYIRRGISAFFAQYALSEFTSEKFAALLDNPDEQFIVSENEDGLDGFIRLSQRKPAPVPDCFPFEISTLYVRPRHHGKGIGRGLLEAGMNHARAFGAPSLWLATNAENAPAIAFYLRQGFEQVGTTEFQIGDAAYPNDVFRRGL
ncbi:GNAT family N-acetyltransferase [Paracoccus aminophilus]|uniref:Acetyltransferase n=1 Tax=Paracoccus aminophilus JCM 7686 TaxID=1367847 RepID=S5XMR6_PARAH|nr:GNAT family N-acetyltransferase [Paracoccus aminophilus]AGT08549.1 acetyltransferase [Paracoccus aminophilus JCM 7686]